MNHIAYHLRDIFFNKRTGRLVYRRGEILKYFFFQNGSLIQVKTNQPDERLGEVLMKLERIPAETKAKMDSFIEPNRSLGEVLKSRGVISEDDLAEALAHQLRESVLNTFAYFDAQLSFQEHEGFSGQAGESRVSIPLLIEYGIRRMTPQPVLGTLLARKIPVPARKTYAYLLTAEEREILEKLGGGELAQDVLKSLSVPPDVFWKSLYLFYCLGIVDFESGAPEPEAKKEAPAPSKAGAPPEMVDVLTLREQLPALTYYQILDVPRTATEEEIKKAYFQRARRFHPDRFDRKIAAEYKSQIDAVFDAVTNAYKVLSNKEARRVYDTKTASLAPQEDAQGVNKRADVKFRQGKTLYNQGRFDEAIAYLEEAVRLRKDKGDYYLLLAMVESKLRAYVKKAEQDFLKAIQLEPWNAEGYFGLGLLYKAEGLQMRAIKQLEKALECDPDHAGAREALEELTGGEKKKGLKALFGMDLFGSKKKK